MKLRKYIFIVILSILALIIFGTPTYAESEEEFKGTRSIAVSVDLSDLDNYVNGGRSYLEAMIRTSSIDWLNYSTSVENINLIITISFDFESYDDYYEKVSYMLEYEPTIINNENMYVESFSTLEMLNYFMTNMQENNLYNLETSEMNLFSEVSSDISFDTGTTYESKNQRINEVENQDENIFTSLEITTTYNENYEREIILKLDSFGEDDKKYYEELIQKRCDDLGVKCNVNTRGSVEFTINFEAKNENELSSYTMNVLNVASGITTKQDYRKGGNIKVTFSEFVDVDTLLTEDGTYKYSFTGKDYYKMLGATDDEVEGYSEEDSTEYYSGRNNTVSFEYSIPFEFEKITVITDFSNNFGKITRTIRMSTNISIAENMHEKIKQSLTDSLQNGMTLNIYDEGSDRYYDIVFSSFSTGKINSMTSELINGNANLEFKSKIVPFLWSSIEDNIEISNICDLVEHYNNVNLEYVFKSGTEIRDYEGSTYITESDSIQFSFKYLDIVKIVIICLVIIIILIIIVIVKNKFRKNKKDNKKKENTENKEEKKINKEKNKENKKLDKEKNKKTKEIDKEKKKVPKENKEDTKKSG